VKLSVLASGSGGNALYVESGETRLLVDAGLSPRELRKRLAAVPGAPALEQLDGLLVTHEHSDHGGHAPALVAAGLRAHATAGTLAALGLSGEGAVIRAGEPFSVGAIEVTPVPLPHDAAEPVGFVLRSGDARIGILTDCGWAAPDVAAAYAGCDVLLLEANHDPEMLYYGAYPPSLKRRIGGRRGHLSNEEAAELLRGMGRALPRLLVLAHLSRMNNRPQLARAAIARVVGRRPVRVLVAAQTQVSRVIEVHARGVQIAGLPGDQLALPLAAPPA
jgi:phosphoribosyl 1,2-cyclic phosphodiesterase